MDEHGRRHFLRSGAFSVFTPNLLSAKAAAQAARNEAAATQETSAAQGVTAAQVERAIRAGVSFLKTQQTPDGSWPNLRNQHQHPAGTTALIVHALLTAGEPADSETIRPALDYLARFTPAEIDGNYYPGR